MNNLKQGFSQNVTKFKFNWKFWLNLSVLSLAFLGKKRSDDRISIK
ncbi:hypothetical protein J577_1195 [Acinetobacter sp. 263903-1]|nr:hypothetical protein J546_1169 [Acinetobacter sp. 1461402]EXB72603.1 hypothetical protein J550_1520 [Acinetobacter sp. 230853]EXC34031.1 hypothetical protein J520_0565 [Acinetobacter sp. 869535]EXE13718.1 hypothetical protein J559_2090 [Acinetobacter sp. 983759]KCX37954.1 hypothetical protein J577_1195 [Acinetobacter sp. 263903-1]